MSEVQTKISVFVDDAGYFYLTEDGKTKKISLEYEVEDTDVYIDYSSVQQLFYHYKPDGMKEEYELTHEEELAVIEYILANYGTVR